MKTNRCLDPNMFPASQEAVSMDNFGCNQVTMCPPIMECPQVNCCHRNIYYEVPHE